ncbi:hypothetical protein CK203_011965 [Vitis vinifera]|uniref:Uncharacterized protein n=1 Tax=Vitis vinifera TaxID=29760 RepID=A0A438K0B6_VITVI|nr:hypothetical protein CK203_011965 [Vitis vinifera]
MKQSQSESRGKLRQLQDHVETKPFGRLGLCGRDSGVLGQKVFGGDGDGGRKVLSLLGKGADREGCPGAMRSFAQTVDDLELIDLPMQGVLPLGMGEGTINPGLD